VVVIAAGVDVQGDRLESEIVGFGRDEESWSLGYIVLPGDPARPEVWSMLDQVLGVTFRHPGGAEMIIDGACIDAGFHQATVQNFCLDRLHRRIYAVKGRAGSLPIWPRVRSRASNSLPLWIVGADTAKESIYARLAIAQPGPGFCHFPISDQHDLSYFEQLTSETCRIRYSKGFGRREWCKPQGVRNEALDCRVYAYAALHSFIASGFRLNQRADELASPQSSAPPPRRQADGDWLGGRDWFGKGGTK
jgi:phage terminase large subunit GpA-like protein